MVREILGLFLCSQLQQSFLTDLLVLQLSNIFRKGSYLTLSRVFIVDVLIIYDERGLVLFQWTRLQVNRLSIHMLIECSYFHTSNCLQLGHMRTNKKCPLYNEEGEPAAWQEGGAASSDGGLVERQGTKITIKRKPGPTRKMEELETSPQPAQPPVAVKTPFAKKEVPAPVPLLKTPSFRMKIKLISGGTPTPSQVSEDSPAPPPQKTPSENGSARPPLLKLKLSSQKQNQNEQSAKRMRQDAELKERERIRERERQEREAYELALVEERERETREREEIERLKQQELELQRRASNEAASSRVTKVEKKLVIVNKATKKRMIRPRDDAEVKRIREERLAIARQAEEYQRALDEELKREEEEREEKERLEREREERQLRMERERHRQLMREKERRRERERVREEVRQREAELEAQRAAAQEREERERERLAREEELQQKQRERERILHKNMRIKQMKDQRSKMPSPHISERERERGKGLKRRPDPSPPQYQHTPDYGNAPKRLRKKGGEVSLPNSTISPLNAIIAAVIC